MTKALWVGLGVLCFAVTTESVWAQTPSTDEQRLEALERRIEQIEHRHENELQVLREQIDALQHDLQYERASSHDSATDADVRLESPPSPPPPASTMANALNPKITTFGNFVARADSNTVRSVAGESIDNRFNLREVEVDFRAAVDPWADGVVIMTLESEIPGDYDVGVEEGYVTFKKLPVLNAAPMGLKLTAGRFRPEFGRINKTHTHDLPWTTRPRSYQTFLGEEGFIENGLGGEVFLPTPGDNNVLSASAAIVNGGNVPVGENNGGENPAYLGHLDWFWDLAPGHDFEIGSSMYAGNFDEAGDLDSRLYGLDLTYKWKPYAQGEWRSFVAGGEAFMADIEQSGGGKGTPMGYYLWAQYQLDRNVYIGARYDFTEDLLDESLNTDTYSAFFTYYTTEFLRLRLGYEHTESDLPEMDGLDTGWLELNFVFGSHPVEPYWVNR